MSADPYWMQRRMATIPGIAGPTNVPAPGQDSWFSQLNQNPLFQVGLGMLSAGGQGQGLGAGLSQGFMQANQSMQNAYENSLRRQQADMQRQNFDMQQREFERAERQSDRQERGQRAVTASRLAQGLGANAQDMPAYWQMVAGLPEVQQTVQSLGIEAPSELSPESWGQFRQQLSNLGSIEGAATTPNYTDDQREYQMAVAQGYGGTLLDYITQIKRAGSATTNVNLGSQGMSQPPSGYFRPDPTKPGLRVESGGPVETAAGKATGENLTSAGYLSRMANAEQLLAGYSPSITDYVAAQRVIESGPTGAIVANAVMSPEGQSYYQAASDWVRAKLRKESGAVIGPQEMINEIRTYFPVPGDAPKTIEQKARARQVAAEGMAKMAGPAADTRPAEIQPRSRGPSRPASKADYDKLPRGTTYVAPDGSIRTKS